MFPLARGLISGLSFLHQHDIVHLDLNPANIVCTPENELKIIDFNLALRAKKGQKIDGVRGTEGWMAPGLYLVHACIDGYLIFDFIEVKMNDGRDGYEPFRADLYSCGKVLQYMDLASRRSLGKWLSEAAVKLMVVDPESRPSLGLVQKKVALPVDIALQKVLSLPKLRSSPQLSTYVVQGLFLFSKGF